MSIEKSFMIGIVGFVLCLLFFAVDLIVGKDGTPMDAVVCDKIYHPEKQETETHHFKDENGFAGTRTTTRTIPAKYVIEVMYGTGDRTKITLSKGEWDIYEIGKRLHVSRRVGGITGKAYGPVSISFQAPVVE